MASLLTHEQIEDFVVNVCGSAKIRYWKDDKLQICCPVHGETHPSCSVNAHFIPEGGNEVLQVFHCFACGAHGTLAKMLTLAREDLARNELEAIRYIEKRYNIIYKRKQFVSRPQVKRYEELIAAPKFAVESSKPLTMLAPFKSGKETFKYFFNRGFTKEEMQEYKIGRDLKLHTVTIPVFTEDKKLAGVIGRILPKYCTGYNERYHVYDFSKGKYLYPLDKFTPEHGEAIIVESQLDAILLRRWGHMNVLATMGGTISRQQTKILTDKVESVILLFDNDAGGQNAEKKALELLKGLIRVKRVQYPYNIGKDPQDWGKNITDSLIKSAGRLKVYRMS